MANEDQLKILRQRVAAWNEKVYTRYERLEVSYLGLIQLSCAMMIGRVLG